MADSKRPYKGKFDPKLAAAYLRDQSKCPFCGSDKIEVRPVDEGEETIDRPMVCTSCHQWWDEIYELTRIEPAEQCCVQCGEIIEDKDVVVKAGTIGELYHVGC